MIFFSSTVFVQLFKERMNRGAVALCSMLADAMGLFYDMALPAALGRMGCGFAVQSGFTQLFSEQFLIGANRDAALDILCRQMRGMDSGTMCSEASRNSVARWFPMLRDALHCADSDALMQHMACWALADPRAHAALLFALYERLFCAGSVQAFPSTRLPVPDFYTDACGDMDRVLHLETLWERALGDDPFHCARIERYRDFVGRVWVPYISQHPLIWGSLVDGLRDRPFDSDARLELYLAVGLAPASGVDFSVDSPVNFPRGC
jgi:hypothetical protein